MAQIGSLSVDLVAELSGWKRDLDKAQKQLNSSTAKMNKRLASVDRHIRRAVRAAGGLGIAFSGAAFASFTQRTIEAVDAIGTMADRIGIGAEALQEFRFAAEQSGVEVAALETALTAMVRRSGEAIRGNDSFRSAFEDIGITVEELRTLDAEGLFYRVAGALGDIENQALRVAAADRIMSEAGRQVINVFADGEEGVRRLVQRLRDLGGVIDERTIRQTQRLASEMQAFTSVMRAAYSEGFLRQFTSDVDDLSTVVADPALAEGLDAIGAGVGAIARAAGQAAADVARFIGAIRNLDAEGILAGIYDRTGIGFADSLFGGSLRESLFGPEDAPGGPAVLPSRPRGGAGLGAGGTDDVQARIDALHREVEQETKRAWAISRSRGELRRMNQVIEAQNEARELGIAVGGEEYTQILSLIRQRDRETRLIEQQEKALDALAAIRERQRDAQAESQRMLEEAFNNSFDRIGTSITDAMVRGEDAMLSLRNVGLAVASELAQAFVRQSITTPLMNALAGSIFSGGGTPALGGGLSPISALQNFGGARASGGPVLPGKTYLVGERGPELYTPKTMGAIIPNHMLGGGSAPAPVTVNVINNGSSEVQTRERSDGRGGRSIDVIIDEAVARQLSTFGSASNRAVRNSLGGRPQLRQR